MFKLGKHWNLLYLLSIVLYYFIKILKRFFWKFMIIACRTTLLSTQLKLSVSSPRSHKPLSHVSNPPKSERPFPTFILHVPWFLSTPHHLPFLALTRQETGSMLSLKWCFTPLNNSQRWYSSPYRKSTCEICSKAMSGSPLLQEFQP